MRVIQRALTFDDVLLLPAHSTLMPRDVTLKTRLTRNISLNLPLVSAAMDTVTESRLAIALAQEGGIGIVHKNLSPKSQAAEAAKVGAVVTVYPGDHGWMVADSPAYDATAAARGEADLKALYAAALA